MDIDGKTIIAMRDSLSRMADAQERMAEWQSGKDYTDQIVRFDGWIKDRKREHADKYSRATESTNTATVDFEAGFLGALQQVQEQFEEIFDL